MKTSRLFMYLFMVFAITLTACSDDGEDGMDGAPGAQGPAGIDGEDGEDGEDGNANVTSVTFNGYSIATGTNQFDIPEITQDIYDHGIVLGYVTVSGNPFWESIPVVIGTEVRLDIDRIYLGGLQMISAFDQLLNFRFVIIEGTPSTRNALGSKEDLREFYEMQGVDFNDYESVKNFFDLK